MSDLERILNRKFLAHKKSKRKRIKRKINKRRRRRVEEAVGDDVQENQKVVSSDQLQDEVGCRIKSRSSRNICRTSTLHERENIQIQKTL